jgi:hypothetical protein
MSVQGNIKPLRSLTEPLQVAKDNGAKRALIPIENKRNFLDVSADIMEHVDPIFFGDPKTAAMKVLREILTDEYSAKALLAPLAEYNTFAARFQCSISAAKPYLGARSIELSCGTIIRLRGLCSALVSNQHDAKSNIVLGQAQVNVHRVDGIEYLTLCLRNPAHSSNHFGDSSRRCG